MTLRLPINGTDTVAPYCSGLEKLVTSLIASKPKVIPDLLADVEVEAMLVVRSMVVSSVSVT
jgi:hypothetical protein